MARPGLSSSHRHRARLDNSTPIWACRADRSPTGARRLFTFGPHAPVSTALLYSAGLIAIALIGALLVRTANTEVGL